MTEIPRLKVRIIETPTLHFVRRPLGSVFVVRRTRQTRSVKVRKIMHRVEDLGILHFLFSYSRVHIRILGDDEIRRHYRQKGNERESSFRKPVTIHIQF
jgi:hypothetical protein